ncbi:MAG: WD40 repeat domain-containing protein [Gemmatimonadota bacterium]
MTPRRHITSFVAAAALLVLSACMDRDAQQLEVVVQRHTPGKHVAFSRDGRYFATTTEYPGRTLLWETASGRLVREFEPANQLASENYRTGGYSHGSRFGSWGYDVAFSPDGRYLASVPMSLRYHVNNGGWWADAPVVWNLATGEPLAPRSHWEREDLLLVNPDLPWTAPELVAWTVVDTDSAARRLRSYKGPAQAISKAARVGVAVDSTRSKVTILELPTNRVLSQLPPEYRSVWRYALSANGSLLALPDTTGAMIVWNLPAMGRIQLDSGGPGVGAVLFSPDDRYLAVARGGTFSVYHTTDLSLAMRDSLTGTGVIAELAFSFDAQFLAVNGSTLRIYNTQSRALLHDSIGTRMSSIESWAAHDTMLAVARGSTVELWPLGEGAPYTIASEIESVASLAFSPDATLLAAGTIYRGTIGRYTGTLNGNLHLWDVGQRRRLLGDSAGLGTTDVRFGPDGRQVLAIQYNENTPESEPCPPDEYCGPPEELDYDVVLTRLDLRTLAQRQLRVLGHTGMDESASAYISERADRVAVRTGSGGAMVEVGTLRNLPTFHADSVMALTYSAFPRGCRDQPSDLVRFTRDSKHAVVLSHGTATLIDAVTGKVLVRADSVFRTHEEGASAAAFAPDGTLLLITCDVSTEGGSRLKRVRTSAHDTLPSLHRRDEPSDDVLFRKDGSFFTRDGNVITLYNAAGVRLGMLLRALSGDWLVVTPDGFYDGSAAGLELVAWRVNGRLISTRELPADRRVRGLLRRLLK